MAVQSSAAQHLIDLLCFAALLRFALTDAEEDSEASGDDSSETPTPLLPPLPRRTFTYFAPGAPVEPIHPAASVADELLLLTSMFAEERKLRMIEADGTHFLIHVEDASEPGTYLVLEFALPEAYPDSIPVVTAPFGQLSNRVLSEAEAAAAAESCCASVADDDLGGPMLYSMYDAARLRASSNTLPLGRRGRRVAKQFTRNSRRLGI
jgi:hypothetical protein